MTKWRKNSQSMTQLQELGALTVRLLRLEAFEKLSRGEAQLRTAGAPVDLTGAYREFINHEVNVAKPTADNSLQLLKITGKSEF